MIGAMVLRTAVGALQPGDQQAGLHFQHPRMGEAGDQGLVRRTQ